jgi:hypothetical protein
MITSHFYNILQFWAIRFEFGFKVAKKLIWHRYCTYFFLCEVEFHGDSKTIKKLFLNRYHKKALNQNVFQQIAFSGYILFNIVTDVQWSYAKNCGHWLHIEYFLWILERQIHKKWLNLLDIQYFWIKIIILDVFLLVNRITLLKSF